MLKLQHTTGLILYTHGKIFKKLFCSKHRISNLWLILSVARPVTNFLNFGRSAPPFYCTLLVSKMKFTLLVHVRSQFSEFTAVANNLQHLSFEVKLFFLPVIMFRYSLIKKKEGFFDLCTLEALTCQPVVQLKLSQQ